jgi:hypothetical protein
MNNDLLVGIIGFLLCSWATLKIIENFKSIFEKFDYLKEENKKISKWKKIKAKVLSKSIGTDYTYEKCTHKEALQFLDIDEHSFYELKEKAEENVILNGNIEINYGYIVDKEKLYSRAIGLLPMDSDLSFFYKINKGDIINILINPEDSTDTFIRNTSDENLNKMEWEKCKGVLPHLIFTFILWVIWGFGIYQFTQ